ncbi:hypothetical protein ITG09_11050 [Vibrio cyclitrophicus]|nr:hypothetical protein ITG09_11050 [Vibrio cyclitrophicus]
MFARSLNGEKTLVVLNLSQGEKALSLPVWMLGHELGELVELSSERKGIPIDNGTVDITVPAIQAKIFDVVNR